MDLSSAGGGDQHSNFQISNPDLEGGGGGDRHGEGAGLRPLARPPQAQGVAITVGGGGNLSLEQGGGEGDPQQGDGRGLVIPLRSRDGGDNQSLELGGGVGDSQQGDGRGVVRSLRDPVGGIDGHKLSEPSKLIHGVDYGTTRGDLQGEGTGLSTMGPQSLPTVATVGEKNSSGVEVPKLFNGGKTRSWIEAVRGKDCRGGKKEVLDYIVPKVFGGMPMAFFTDEALERGLQSWRNTIVAHVIGARPYYQHFKAFAQRQWKPKGEMRVHSRECGFFLVQFDEEDDCRNVIDGGPWLFDGKLVILKEWTKDTKYEREVLESIPVWVRFPRLPLQFWNRECLSAIASLVGRPIYTDETTSSRSRLNFARILVEVSAKDLPKKEIMIKMEDGQIFKQVIEFEGLPPSCERCHCFGHLAKACGLGESLHNVESHKFDVHRKNQMTYVPKNVVLDHSKDSRPDGESSKAAAGADVTRSHGGNEVGTDPRVGDGSAVPKSPIAADLGWASSANDQVSKWGSLITEKQSAVDGGVQTCLDRSQGVGKSSPLPQSVRKGETLGINSNKSNEKGNKFGALNIEVDDDKEDWLGEFDLEIGGSEEEDGSHAENSSNLTMINPAWEAMMEGILSGKKSKKNKNPVRGYGGGEIGVKTRGSSRNKR